MCRWALELCAFTFKKRVPSLDGVSLLLAVVKAVVAPDPEIGLKVDVVDVEVDLEVGVVPRLAPLLLRLVICALQEGNAALSRL